MDSNMSSSVWASLGCDLTELILSRLPLVTIIAASAVCRSWRSIIVDISFRPRATTTSWFFLYGHHNHHPPCNQAFAFDPDADHWVTLPPATNLTTGHGGFSFAVTPSPTRLSYAPLLRGPGRLTAPLSSSRSHPLIAAFSTGPRFIVAGGACYLGRLIDIEDRLAVEIYDPSSDSWELSLPIPAVFQSGSTSQWLTSALMHKNLFFIAGIYSGAIAAFDLTHRLWSSVQYLRPPGVLFSFLIASSNHLILAALCTGDTGTRFVLWRVDHRTLEFAEIGAMPQDLLLCLFHTDEDDGRFASLKCVGLNDRVYVFNEDHHKGYPACVCEISDDICKWRKVPPLPGRINQFHKVVAFSSAVPIHTVLTGGGVDHVGVD